MFAPLGWRAIGGPAVHVALMERELVRRRRWMDREEFGRLFALCNLLPGPGSTQLALLIGLRRAGVRGMLLTALLFIGPAVAVMLVLSELYQRVGTDRSVQLVLLGVEAAVVGVLARAAVDLSALPRRRWANLGIAAAALACGVLSLNPAAVLGGGAVLGWLAWVLETHQRPLGGAASRTRSVAALLAAAHVPLAGGAALGALALTFLKIGAIAFGSGYVLLPFLHNDFVGGSFGLTDRQVADAFAIAQVTPGPVFAVGAFIGDRVAGVPGGLVAAVAIFAPSLVFVPLAGAAARTIQRHAWLRASLDGVVAAALGLIASACYALGVVAFRGPVEVLTAVLAFGLLLRWPRAQPMAVVLGVVAGFIVLATH
ncbi:MAG TPA: chromate efflux transporter [Candidatus Dormibacteraeota bacterium]|nr:chromate efflux transporter [Candidatus Dormibacteraeota bacterium]